MCIRDRIYGISGTVCRKYFKIENMFTSKPVQTTVLLGSLGIVCTFVYDIWTNALDGLIIYQSVDGMILRIITGIPFSIIHQIANFAVFSVLVPIFIYMLTKKLNIIE